MLEQAHYKRRSCLGCWSVALLGGLAPPSAPCRAPAGGGPGCAGHGLSIGPSPAGNHFRAPGCLLSSVRVADPKSGLLLTSSTALAGATCCSVAAAVSPFGLFLFQPALAGAGAHNRTASNDHTCTAVYIPFARAQIQLAKHNRPAVGPAGEVL